MEPQIRPKSHFGPSWGQEVAHELKNVPGTSIFNDSSSNFAPNSIDFRSYFLQFLAPGSARWRLYARSALDNLEPAKGYILEILSPQWSYGRRAYAKVTPETLEISLQIGG